MTVFRFSALAVILTTLAAAGCGGPPFVTGTVTLDGKPVEEGRIEFFPDAANPGPSGGGGILKGKYQGTASAGKNLVKIYASRKTGQQIKTAYGGTSDATEEIIPDKYNDDSQLFVEIKPGKNVHDFPLKTE